VNVKRVGNVVHLGRGGAGQPPSGSKAGHSNLCINVPGSLPHNLHSEDNAPLAVFATLLCGHCPPTKAEVSHGRMV
jgi:hypothetical protein